MEKLISVKDFSFQYLAQKKPTLKNINLDIYKGEKVLICGSSGSGKSTLGNCINGLIPFSYEGKIYGSFKVNGIETKDSSIFELSNYVGTVLQDSDGQFIGLTVGEDVAFSLENNCVSKDEMHILTKEVSKKVGVEKQLEYSPHELSGGQKQRVSLAGVLVNSTKILLFDEPLANLDPKTGKSAIELIDKIQKESGATVIIIEHRLEDVLWRSVDRIILMNDGEIIADMKPSDMLCSNLLIDQGIREPLYITCLKYAGVKITPDKKPEHIDSLSLDEEDIIKINEWYERSKFNKKTNDNDSILKVENLSFAYANRTHNTLDNINFDIKQGEMISLVGKNGAGKSTLAKLICNFEHTSQGEIYFKGRNISDDSIRQRARYIGYVMQNPNQMISQAKIYDEVALGLKYLNYEKEEIDKKVYETLKICGLYEFRNWPISALSYGQRKRVTIASVLVMGPELIILDEPTAGQDYKHYTEIMEFLKELNNHGITVLLITHDMHLMLEYTPRALVLVNGKLIQDASASEILCDKEIVDQASLKQTSLFELANKAGIEDPVSFTDCFISYDQRGRNNAS